MNSSIFLCAQLIQLFGSGGGYNGQDGYVLPLTISGVNGTLRVSSIRTSPSNEWVPEHLVDGNLKTAWSADPADRNPWVKFSFDHPVKIQGNAIAAGVRRSLVDIMVPSTRISAFIDSQLVWANDGKRYLAYSYLWNEWDSIHPFVWDGKAGDKKELRVFILSKSGKEFTFRFREPEGYVARSNTSFGVAISELHLLSETAANGKGVMPQVMLSLFGRNRRALLGRQNPFVQDFKKDVFVWKNKLNEDNCDGEEQVLPARNIYLRSRVNQRSNGIDEYFSLQDRSQEEQNGFWFQQNDEGRWIARFPHFEWEKGFNISSHPVVEGWRNSIVALRNTDGTLPQKAPQVAYQNSQRQVEKIREPERFPDTNSVKIGSQIWLKRNLSKSPRDFRSLCWGLRLEDTGKWNRNCAEFGRLYRSDDALDVCPVGWHIPSVFEWQTLFQFVDSSLGRRYSSSQWWFFLMEPGKWYSGEKQMDPFGFSAKYYTRPAIGPVLQAENYPTFLTADSAGCMDGGMDDIQPCEQVISLIRFPMDRLDATGKFAKAVIRREDARGVKMEFAPVRCIREQ